jgi:hypothetical protein
VKRSGTAARNAAVPEVRRLYLTDPKLNLGGRQEIRVDVLEQKAGANSKSDGGRHTAVLGTDRRSRAASRQITGELSTRARAILRGMTSLYNRELRSGGGSHI